MGTTRSKLTFLSRSIAAAAVALALGSEALRGASLVQVINARVRTSSVNSSIDLTVPFSGVGAGNSIVVTLQAGGAAGAIACSDPVNGTYDADVVSAEGGARIAILSKHGVGALSFGHVVTCTYPSFSGASSASAYEFAGLEPSATLDGTAQSGGSAAGAASSGLTAATAQLHELVFGFVWLSSPAPGQTFTFATSGSNPPESPYAPAWGQPFAAGTQRTAYRFVNGIRQYEANGVVAGTGEWKAQVATYRLAPDPCNGVVCDDGNPCTVDSCDSATGLCANVAGNSGLVCRAPTGECDRRERCDGVNAECPPDVFVEAEAPCGDSNDTGDCDHADTCDGLGTCQNNRAPDGAPCGDTGSSCVNQDTCEAGMCRDQGFATVGAACGDPSSGACDSADSCDGAGACRTNLAEAGAACSDENACTASDACDGSGTCVGGGPPAEVCENRTDDDCDGAVDEGCDAEGPITTLTVASPNPAAVSSTVTLTARVDDAETGGSTIASAAYDVEGGAGGAMESQDGAFDESAEDVARYALGFPATGVHRICVRGTDAAGNTGAEDCTYLAVYDPDAGFVTGGGWIPSPAGAYAPDPALAGKAHFAFVARYQKGGKGPVGEAQLHLSGFRFEATVFDWLVISGARARLQGSGKANGAGGYDFLLTVWDGQANGGGADRLRLRVWDAVTNAVIYDSQPGDHDNADATTALGGGNVLLHKK